MVAAQAAAFELAAVAAGARAIREVGGFHVFHGHSTIRATLVVRAIARFGGMFGNSPCCFERDSVFLPPLDGLSLDGASRP